MIGFGRVPDAGLADHDEEHTPLSFLSLSLS